MTPEIHELDADTRDRIAAGEVVERPASVVKELLENALDAGASRIDVAVEAGGKDRIRVSDDGHGMSDSDARMAVREHTTSKLSDIDQLASIGTLGFRGEALHAIGSVAKLALRTKPRGGDRGTEVVVQDGELVSSEPVGCPEGTTVEVTNLFGTVPARRQYLKTDATEFDRIQRIVTGYALANPDVAISLEHDGRRTFATAGDGDRLSAVLSVYGREVAESMIELQDGDGDGPISGLAGLVSHPETNRAGRAYMTTLVNGRFVTANVVREAIVEAYGTQLAPDRYPFAIVDVELPDGGVDVNVHPRKLEVLFADETGLKTQIRSAVERTLLEEGLIRSRAPRGRSAAEQTDIGHETKGGSERDESRAAGPDQGSETHQAGADEDVAAPGPNLGSTLIEGDTSTASTESESEGPVESKRGSSGRGDSDIIEENQVGHTDMSRSSVELGRSNTPIVSTPDSDSGTDSSSVSARSDVESGAGAPAKEPGEPDADAAGTGTSDATRRFRDPPAQRTLTGGVATASPDEFDRLPAMRVLGQFDETYLV
ncbi:MAG: DNA mismatch repair endonuclease MutL, partial [Natronomonas sp.]